MTSLGAATARWAYVQCDVYEAILIAGQKDVCMCAADHERSQRRSAAVAGMLRRGSVRGRERWMNVPVQQHGLQTNNALPGTRPAAEPATRLQHGGLVWVLRCPHRVYDVERRFK